MADLLERIVAGDVLLADWRSQDLVPIDSGDMHVRLWTARGADG